MDVLARSVASGVCISVAGGDSKVMAERVAERKREEELAREKRLKVAQQSKENELKRLKELERQNEANESRRREQEERKREKAEMVRLCFFCVCGKACLAWIPSLVRTHVVWCE